MPIPFTGRRWNDHFLSLVLAPMSMRDCVTTLMHLNNIRSASEVTTIRRNTNMCIIIIIIIIIICVPPANFSAPPLAVLHLRTDSATQKPSLLLLLYSSFHTENFYLKILF